MDAANDIQTSDMYRPVEVAHRVWWVGHHQENDVFQCHVYLIEHGDQSVLIDPGSELTFETTRQKIEEVTPFDNIRWFLCHHQDPDITAALPHIDRLVTRDDAAVISHWRAAALLKHYGLNLPFWLVEKHNWHLDLGGRVLDFYFTPYAHFPGAFVTHDRDTGVLFSSDIFGGFTEGFQLYAQDESYFEALRPFHEHYMPSREILTHVMTKMEQLPITMICPQHGSIIPGHLVQFMIDQLKTLDCGLYLLAEDNTDIQKLSRLNRMLRDITQTMVVYRDFRDIAGALLDIARRVLPVEALEFYSATEEDRVIHFAPETRYRGVMVETPPGQVGRLMEVDVKTWHEETDQPFTKEVCPVPEGDDGPGGEERICLLVPLFTPDEGKAQAVAILRLENDVEAGDDVSEVIDQMSVPLQVAVERESIYRTLDLERQQFYERSIRDPLTGLFTRLYMQDSVQRLFGIHDRDPNAAVGVALFDIDYFKSINDTYGHNEGDEVLKRVARVLMDSARSGDLAVRLGGEEFAVFVVGQSALRIDEAADRIRRQVAAIGFEGALAGRGITVSAGAAVRAQGEDLSDFIQRADEALYEAKSNGRNQVCRAEPAEDHPAGDAEGAE